MEIKISNTKLKKNKIKKYILITVISILILIIFFSSFYYYIVTKYDDKIYSDCKDVPSCKVALVFGAGYRKGGVLFAVLQDRVEKAVELYKLGKVQKLLMSGDNPIKSYNEPVAMRNEAIKLGVKPDDIRLDFAGKRTYYSCYRIKNIWLQNEIVLVSQEYHLPRALYICNELGINAYGVISDRRPYVNHEFYKIREIPAILLTWVEINVTQPLPRFLGKAEDIMQSEPPSDQD